MTAPAALLDASLRRVVATATGEFRPFDRYGAALPGLSWLPLSLDQASGHSVYLLHFAPGARGPAHEHAAPEAFLVMDGTFTDSDGTVLKAGDFARYEAGSKHFSYSESGCTLLVILQKKNVGV